MVIGVAFDFTNEHFRRCLEGLHHYVVNGPGWRLRPIPAHELRTGHEAIRGLQGLIGAPTHGHDVELLRGLGIPVVNVSNNRWGKAFPSILSDDLEVGRLVGREFCGLGYRHCLFLRGVDREFSREREQGLREALGASFPNVQTGAVNDSGTWIERLVRARAPVAVLADSDVIARLFIEELAWRRLRVPGQFCVVGVNDDPMERALCPVALASVRLGSQRMGFLAGECLARLLADADANPPPVRVPPVGLVRRRSLEASAVTNPGLARALEKLRDQPAKWGSIADLARAVKMPRRSLERAFREELGHSPHEEWTRYRMDRVRWELATGNDTLEVVADRCGFADAHSLCIAFKRATGMTPGAYRGTHRGPTGAAKSPW